jgi:hypothetical protein
MAAVRAYMGYGGRVPHRGVRLGLLQTMQTIMSTARARSLALLAVAGLALALGACSKCDIPAWGSPSPPPPQSCHDGPDTK